MADARFDAVDGLRGCAALLIVVYHVHLNTGVTKVFVGGVNVLLPLYDGWTGVNLFLVLSGFCLFWPYARNPDRVLALPNFFMRRVRRIFPGYYASLVLVPLAFLALAWIGVERDSANSIEGPDGLLDALLHLVLLQGLWSGSVLSWNSVTWSLSLEWMWYLLFPAAVFAARRFGVMQVLIASLAIGIAYRWGINARWGSGGGFPGVSYELGFALRQFLPARLPEFVFGMVVASAAVSGRVPRIVGPLAIPAGLLLLLIAHRLLSVGFMLPWRNLLFSAGYALILFRVVTLPTGWVASSLARPLLVKIGEWSFSLYLLHMPIALGVIAIVTALGLVGLPRLIVSSTLAVPLTVVIAAAAYLAFERPFLRKKSSGDAVKLRDRPSEVIAP